MNSRSTLVGAHEPLKGIALICIAVLLFSSHDALSKYLSSLYPIVLVVWFRYVGHTALMAAIFIPRAGLRVLRTKRPLMQCGRALCLIGTSICFTNGLRYIPLAEATAVNFLMPLLVTAMSVPLLGERVTRVQWAAVMVGFIGVMIIVRPGGALFTPAVLLPMGSAVFFAIYQIMTRKLAATDNATTSNVITGVVNSLVMSAMLPFYWEMPQWYHLPLLLALGLCGMFGHLLLTHAFRFAPPAMLAPFSYAQIIFAGVLGWLFFDHMPDHWAQVGMLIICLSGLSVAWMQRRRPAPLAARAEEMQQAPAEPAAEGALPTLEAGRNASSTERPSTRV